jgi:aldose 1-epimerase
MVRMTGMLTSFLLVTFGLALGATAEPRGIRRQAWGKGPGGAPVELFTLTNAKGASVAITTYGAIVVSVNVPDKAGALGDVVLGFDSLEGYLGTHPFFGAIVGRYGNRIAAGQFTLDGKTYTLAKNNGANSLHGGLKGFDKYVWKGRELQSKDGLAIELTHLSPDRDEGFPGQLTAHVTYTWTDANELRVDYHATTDKPTVVNLTNHSYFNLAGQGAGTILAHTLQLSADKYTPVVQGLIPTGELAPVDGTPFDFRQATPIGARIDAANEQITLGGGYDHNFVVNGQAGTLRPAARVEEPTTGRTLEVLTTEPGIQFYTGNFLDGTIKGKGGKVYPKRAALCLETQHYPDSPNQPSFPSVVLRPGQEYKTTTVYRFGVKN